MRLSLEQVVPIPLKDRINESSSRVWKQDLTFNAGEHIFIQAPSGTGKTTLIHFLYGLRNDFEGEIQWDAFAINNIGSEHLSQLRTSSVSVIFQDMRLFPDLTTWENLEIKRQLTNIVTAEAAAKWMEQLGLKDKMNSLASTLSYGEQQRVSILRALLQPFNWLLMDEPFSHLDNNNIQRASVIIKEVVARNNAGIILADLEDNNYFNYTRKLLL